MAFSKPFTQRERDYVRDRWPDESAEEIASDLRRSVRGVYKLINDMHLRESPEPPMQEGAGRRPRRDPGGGCAAPGGDDASRLTALRDLLWADLLQAGPKVATDGMTQSSVRLLDASGRVDEIARMLGGAEVTAEAKAAAKRLLGGF